MRINSCPLCLDKQRKTDDLREENRRLRAELNREKRKIEDGAFGSSTPSSKLPIKPNSEEKEKKPKGARPGHKGNGRKSHKDESADKIVEVEPEFEVCPECGFSLERKEWKKEVSWTFLLENPKKFCFVYPRGIAMAADAPSLVKLRECFLRVYSAINS